MGKKPGRSPQAKTPVPIAKVILNGVVLGFGEVLRNKPQIDQTVEEATDRQ